MHLPGEQLVQIIEDSAPDDVPPRPSTPAAASFLVEDHLDDTALLILDNISALFGGEENDSSAWQAANEWLLALRRRGVAVRKARNVYLTDEGTTFFESLSAGRAPGDLLLHRSDGEPCGANHQKRRMEIACEMARIDPPISFHIVRHTYASLYLMAGRLLPTLAQQLGHAETRMTTLHYSHLAEDWRAEEARRYLPRFSLRAPSTVVDLRHRVGQPGHEKSSREV